MESLHTEVCKVYNDGTHYVAVPYVRSKRKSAMKDTTQTERDKIFDTSFCLAKEKGLKSQEQRDYIIEQIQEQCGELEDIPEYVYKKHIKQMHLLHQRKLRFERIVYMNEWDYFVTFTYDDKKQTPESFEEKLKKTLQNLHTRKGWLYAGTFELSPYEERLHFHGLVNTYGNMVGEIEEIEDYSTKTHTMQITHRNTFFNKRFGRNDFSAIDKEALLHGDTVNYISKYIIKSGRKIIYSRGLNSPKYILVPKDEVCAEYESKVGVKYVLFDDFDVSGKTWQTLIEPLDYLTREEREKIEWSKRDYYADIKEWYYAKKAEEAKEKRLHR